MNSHRRVARLALIWLLLAVLIQFVMPAVAQEQLPGEDGSWQPVEYAPPTMAFQPPADADDLDDFIPAGSLLTDVAVGLPEPTALPVSDETAIGELPGGIIPTLEPPATLTPEPTITPTADLSVTLPLHGELPNVISFNEGETALVIEENTLGPDAEIQFTAIAVPVITATNNISNPAGTQFLLQFQLEAFEDGVQVGEFDKPVRIVVDLRELAADLDSVYAGNFFLAYRDENDPDVWRDVPITIHQETGLISAEVMHFSDWASGARPERWKPSWNPPAVSAFSGAATYQYPIQVPPGRSGLQPSIALSYSSRGVDGMIFDPETPPLATGWSVAEISVVREEVQSKDNYGNLVQYHPDKFRLVLDGAGYELIPADPTTNNTVRYYAKDGPNLRIYRYYDAGAPNTEKLYWMVDAADGTRYRLGYTSTSEEWQRTGSTTQILVEGHQGYNIGDPSNRTSAIAWHADTVTDAFGNQMRYDYFTSSTTETVEDGSGDTISLTTQKNRIDSISYNYTGRVTSLPAANTVAQPTGTPASRIEFRPGSTTNPFTSIYVYHGNVGTTTPIMEYRITRVGWQVGSPGCLIYENGQPYPERYSTTHVITEIRQYTSTDNNASTNDAGYALPPTTFSYEHKPHFYKNGQPCFRFYYLTEVNSGYGGEATFTYTSDNRSIGTYTYLGNDSYTWPATGYNYFVTNMASNDGRNPLVNNQYSYYAPCYGQLNSSVGTMNGATTCLATGSTVPEYGGIVGFATVTETLVYNSQTINRQVTNFSQNANGPIGRPTQQDVKDAASTLLVRTATSYSSTTFGPTNYWYTNQVDTTHYTGASTLTTRMSYGYDTVLQGGSQYGNQVAVYDLGDQSNAADDRTTLRRFYPNTSGNSWFVGQVAVERVFSGVVLSSQFDTATPLRETFYYYDGHANVTDVPTQGAATMVKTGKTGASLGGGVNGLITTQTSYDVYGNVNVATDGRGNTTDINYESTYNLYPIQVTNDLGQATTFEVYGFNGVAIDGFQEQPGLLKQVTGINGAITKYEYDPFGRLHAKFDGYDFTGFADSLPWNGDPVERYYYWDNTWNDPTTFLNPAGNAPFAITTQQRPASYTVASDGYAFISQTSYDGFTRPIQERVVYAAVQGQGLRREIITSTAYGAQGQPVCQTAPHDIALYADRGLVWPASTFVNENCATMTERTTTTYDALGRPLVVTAPDGSTTEQVYAVTNNITVNGFSRLQRVQVIDANDHVVNRFTDARGQLVKVRENSGTHPSATAYADTEYTYDLLGNLTDVETREPTSNGTGTLLRHVQMVYDVLGRKIELIDPDMGHWYYDYDAAGNPETQTDARNNSLCYVYNGINQITSKWSGATCTTQLASYFYHTSGGGKGQPSEIRWTSSATNNRETMSYDSLGRLTSHTRIVDNRSYTMSYSNFDPFHRPATVTYPNGEAVNYTFDHEGENSLTAGGTSLVSGVQYNGRGQMTTLDRTSVTDTTYSYFNATDGAGGGPGDSNFRMSSMTAGSLLDLDYTYDRVGNIVSLTDQTNSAQVQTFGYDELNRLTSAYTNAAGSGQYNHTYTYDKLGNIDDYDGTNFNYNDAAHKQAVTHFGTTQYFWYDANGNMTTRVQNSVNYSQVFNVDSRLTSVTNNTAGGTTTFSYDASGQRAKTVEPDGTIIDYPFAGYEVVNPGQIGSTTRSSYSLAGQVIAQREKGLAVAESFDDGNETGWTEHVGTWAAQSQTGEGYAYRQSDTASSATNSSYPLSQSGAMAYEWTVDFVSGSTQAGLHLFASTANTTNHGNSYLVWQGGGSIVIYESIADTLYQRAIGSFPLANGQTLTYKATYDPSTGVISVWRDGVFALSWTDSTPLTSGSYVAFRTNTSEVRFDNLRITGSTATYSNLYYFYADHLGSASVIANSSGGMVDRTYFLPFGGYRNGDVSIISERGFTGHLQNDDIGLTYMNARFYVPGIGRFASADSIVPDPGNPQTFNRYSYVNNNPVNLTDPSGHDPEPPPNPFAIFAEWLGFPDTNGTSFEGLTAYVGELYVEAMTSFNENVGPWIEAGAGMVNPLYDAVGIVTGESPMTGVPYSDGERMFSGLMLLVGVTPLDEVGELALGLSKNLGGFKKLFPQAQNFTDLGLNPYAANFGDKLLTAMQNSDTIRFDVSGMSYLNTTDGVLKGPSNLNLRGSTNWELRTIWDNPDLLSKTKFYLNGIEITVDELLKLH